MLSKAATSAFALAVLTMASGAAYAQEPYDLRTNFTFNQPVQLPGVELPPGEYIFRLADPDTSRKVVQVLSADRKEVYAMLHTLPRQRAEAPDDPEISFMETAEGVPPAIQTWWHRGERRGREFMYSKEQAARIATAIVPAQPEITLARNDAAEAVLVDSEESELGVVEGSGLPADDSASAEVNDPEAAAIVADAQSSAPVSDDRDAANREVGAVGTSGRGEPGAVGTSGNAQASNELPQTAGEMPLIALFGLLALGGSFGVRRLAQARARI
jgi:hypothetical protein